MATLLSHLRRRSVRRGPSVPVPPGGWRSSTRRGSSWRVAIGESITPLIVAASSEPPSEPPSATPPAPPPPVPPAPPPPSEAPKARSGRAALRDLDPAVLLSLMRLYAAVLDVLLRCGIPESDAPDVAQAVILYAAPRWAELPIPPDDLAGKRRRAYLVRIALGFAASYHVAEQKREERALRAALAEVPEAVPSPEELVLHREADAEQAAEVAVDELRTATKPEFWAAFYAHVVEGLPVATIARLEGIPSATVYNRLRLARRDLRAAITRKRARRQRERQRTPAHRHTAR